MTDSAAKALVIFSGGQDSTTCLAWALDRFDAVETIGFDYGQRHAVEMECRPAVLSGLANMNEAWGAKLDRDHIVDLGVLGELSNTALTRDVEIAFERTGLPTTFVPGRNLAFLTFAGVVAYRRGIEDIVLGVCETDYSGYPDCRNETVEAMEKALSLGMDRTFTVHTPLMWIDKAATWQMAKDLGGDGLIELIVEETHSCYLGDRSERHDWGYGCGECPACEIRARGYGKFRGA